MASVESAGKSETVRRKKCTDEFKCHCLAVFAHSMVPFNHAMRQLLLT